MNWFKLFLTVMLVAVNSGCAYLDTRSSNLPEKIEGLIALQQYGEAQRILSKVPETHPDSMQLLRLKKDIDQQAAVYEKLALDEGEKLEQQGEWQLALRRYKEAFDRLPRSMQIQTAQQKLQLRQAARVVVLELDLLIAHGEWLKQSLLIQKELSRIASSSWVEEIKRKELKNGAQQLAAELAQQAKFSLEQDKLSYAEQLLDLATQLHPELVVEKTQKALAKRQLLFKEAAQKRELQFNKAAQKEQQRALDHSEKKAREAQLSALQQALDNDRLGEALPIAVKLQQQGELAKGEQLIQQLELAIREKVDEAMNLGVEHYGQGLYKQAILSWRYVLELEPGNRQAAEHVERAERIVEKLQRLREEKAE